MNGQEFSLKDEPFRARLLGGWFDILRHVPGAGCLERGARATQSRKAYAAFASGVGPASRSSRRAIAAAACTKTGSFNVVNACKGVLVRDRRVQSVSCAVPSNAMNDGYGADRRRNV